MRDFRNIKAWQLADDLAVMIYKSSRNFPKEELYALTNQIRRAAYSVPANITEGSARNSMKEYLQFLYIARASLAEVQYFIHLSNRLKYLEKDESARLESQSRETFACLQGLIKAVKTEA